MNTEIKNFVPYAKQSINQLDCDIVIEALKGDVITRGGFVEKFENKISDFCKVKHAVTFHSGTTALHAAYYAANVGPSHQVLTTPNTFVGTFIGALHLKAKLKFVDIDRSSGNLNSSLIKSQLQPKNNVVVPVHFSGIPVDIERLKKIAPEAVIIEDAAHALGSLHSNGMPVGSCYASDMTVLSFHPAKTITTGEGGIVTTNNDEIFKKLKLFRNNGIIRNEGPLDYPGSYSVEGVSGNYNFTDFQAALGISQLSRVKEFVEKRKMLMKAYRSYLEGYDFIRLFSSIHDENSAHHICVIQIDFNSLKKTRRDVMLELRARNIGTQVHYMPAYHHSIVSHHAKQPEMESYYQQALTLPLYYDLDVDIVEEICKNLLQILKK